MRYTIPATLAVALALQACAAAPAPAPASSHASCERGLDTAYAGVSSYNNAALTNQSIRFKADIGVLEKPDCQPGDAPFQHAG